MKKFLITIAFTFILLIPIKAEAKDYSIDEADFYVDIQENGDAVVTEKWSLDFDGQYSRFYKDISN